MSDRNFLFVEKSVSKKGLGVKPKKVKTRELALQTQLMSIAGMEAECRFMQTTSQTPLYWGGWSKGSA